LTPESISLSLRPGCCFMLQMLRFASLLHALALTCGMPRSASASHMHRYAVTTHQIPAS
jgi:hypothetical protein